MINIAVADVITINQTSAAVAADTTSVLDFNLLQSTIASGFVSGILFKSSCVLLPKRVVRSMLPLNQQMLGWLALVQG